MLCSFGINLAPQYSSISLVISKFFFISKQGIVIPMAVRWGGGAESQEVSSLVSIGSLVVYCCQFRAEL